MTVEAAIRQELLDDAGITGLHAQRVYGPVADEKAAFPYITIQVIGDVPVHHQGAHAGFAEKIVQIDSVSDDMTEARASNELARLVLDGFTPGTLGSGGNTVVIDKLFKFNGFDTVEPPDDASPETLNIRRSEYVISHVEAIPSN